MNKIRENGGFVIIIISNHHQSPSGNVPSSLLQPGF